MRGRPPRTGRGLSACVIKRCRRFHDARYGARIDPARDLVGRADELLGRNRFADARAAYQEALEEREDASALAGFSAACRGVGDIPAAVSALERAYLLRVNADERGLQGPDQAGAFGRWVCRGTVIADAATLEPGNPLVVTTVLHVLGDAISAMTGPVHAAPDAIATEGFEPEPGIEVIRTVVGGYGRYSGAAGDLIAVERGTNDTMIQFTPEVAIPAPNYQFTFALAAP